MLEISRCPTCGRPHHAPVYGKRRERIIALLQAFPDGATREELFEFVWRDDPDGGPLTFSALRALISRMNKQMQQYGWAIKSCRGPGARYRLEAI